MAKSKPPMNNMMKQVQQMQEDMFAAQAQLAETTVDGTAGGGMVKATVTGTGDLISIELSPDVVDPDDIEMLQDLVVAAVADANRAAQALQSERMGGVTGGIDLSAFGLG
ncbi:MAG: YbaB/EbfC family nucleoid-associated protein [Acidimicrobiia bacterium]